MGCAMKALLASVVLPGLCAIAPVQAQSTETIPPVPRPAPPCSSVQSHQFDFWLGEWIVHAGPKGDKLAGHNRIERSDNGCWLSEHWRGARGNRGTSLNAWDAQHQVWRQFWVGSDGAVLRLSGGIRDGAMVMGGQSPTKDGGVQQQRITWTPRDDGSVTQQWDTSDDDGKTWQTVFLGIYRHPPVAEAKAD